MGSAESVDARRVSLDQLLDHVQSQRATVRVLRDGRAVAEVTPLNDDGTTVWRLRPVVDALKPRITAEDAVAPLDEDDWPTEARP